jgi:hypothetical protein
MDKTRSTSVSLKEDDEKIVGWLARHLAKDHGEVSFTFIARLAIRALKDQLSGKKA